MADHKNQKWLSILVVMMTLGAAWAIRGRFGHEYGAAWAGSLGVLAMVLISGRKDWLKNWLSIAAIGAIGWGMTGMISYGKVIGYGKSNDWLNASYGLLSLFLIGGLFGFLGGGLTGLMLETSEKKKPDWAALITQMVAGGVIFWGFLIHQLEWFMTPPRSELWAACLGAAFALAWYLKRNQFESAFFTAMTTMLGAGFGFGFGNFLQTMGQGMQIGINWWNVMEYSIGFFGGLGMAYGIFSRRWPAMIVLPRSSSAWSALLLFILIPVWVITNAFETGKIERMAATAGVSDLQVFSNGIYLQVFVVSLLAMGVMYYCWRQSRTGETRKKIVLIAFVAGFLWYQMLKLITSGIFGYYHWSMEELTVLNFIAVVFLISTSHIRAPQGSSMTSVDLGKGFYWLWFMVLILLVLLAGISSSLYTGLAGTELRFGL